MLVPNPIETNNLLGEQLRTAEAIKLNDIAEEVHRDKFPPATPDQGFDLTQLEKRIVALNLSGCSLEESAEVMDISEPTLRFHLDDVCDKLGVANQFELILFAIDHHLVDPGDVFPAADLNVARLGSALPISSQSASGLPDITRLDAIRQ